MRRLYWIMYLRTLGELRLEGVVFPRPKLLLLLAYLALEGPKSRPHLAELFWHGAAEPTTSVRMALRQLRQAASGSFETIGNQVRTTVPTDATVLLERLEGGDLPGAIDLYRGAFVADVCLRDWSMELEEWVYTTREFLGERMRGALLTLAEREAASGNFKKAAQLAERAYRLPGAPPPEPDALGRIYRFLVAGESVRVYDLQREAKEYNLTLKLTREEARGQSYGVLSGSRPVALHNLPVRSTSFVGRDPELLELARLLAEPDTRLITLTGPGGVGKSRLAVQVAYQELSQQTYEDGIYFVSLDALTDANHVPSTIAGTLGLSLPGKHGIIAELSEALATRRLLLVLDNYEHLMTVTAILSELLVHAPGLKLLVTSRERLGLEEEQLFFVEGLPFSEHWGTVEEAQHQDAVRLFVERAKRVQLSFALTPENLRHVLRICNLLGGSPLGIELAAAWVRFMPTAEIAYEIGRSLDILQADERNVADRHRSLRATFDYSWKLLSPREQKALRRLSVFVGGFSREAAARVAGTTIPLLASLLDKSLLRVLGGGRYDRHPLVYQYALEKLAESAQEQEAVRASHASYFLAFAGEAESHHRGVDQVTWLARLEAENDNLRAALGWSLGGGDPETGLKLAVTLFHFWYFRSHLSEGGRWLDLALAATAEYGPDLDPWRARAFHAAGVLADERGNYAQATEFFEARLALARTLGDALGQAVALNSLGIMATERQDHAHARTLLEESLALRRELGQREHLAHPLSNLGVVALAQDDYVPAQAYLEESLAISRELGDTMGVTICLSNLAATLLDAGSPNRARELFEEALKLFQELGDKDGQAFCLEGLGAVAGIQGCAREAIQICGAADALRQAIGAPLSPSDKTRLERRLNQSRTTLDDKTFASMWAEGRAMTLDKAISIALVATAGSSL